MKFTISLIIVLFSTVGLVAQQPTPTPTPAKPLVQRRCCRQRFPKRAVPTAPTTQPTQPTQDLAQNVHRCVLSYNRDEVVARRRAAGLPVNLDTANSQERRIDTGQSTAPTSISVNTDDDKPLDESAAKPKVASDSVMQSKKQ